MNKRYVPFLAIALAIGLAGCGIQNTQARWPELRPLGNDLPTFRSPIEPPPLASVSGRAHTGLKGDGDSKIYVSSVEQAIRISTGERGEKAL